MIINTIKSLIDSTQVIQLIPMTGEDPLVVDGTDGKNYKFISADFSRFADIIQNPETKTNHLRIVPISIKEAKVTGSPVYYDKIIVGLTRPFLYWSPDGSGISMSLNGDIWVFPIDGGDPYNLTNSPEVETIGSWSPDGKMMSIDCKTGELWIKKIVDANSGEVLYTMAEAYYDGWSPDSKEIAIVLQTGWLSVLNIDTGKSRELVNWKGMGLFDVFQVSWSPDGRQIAFVGDLEANKDSYRIFLADPNGGEAKELNTGENGYISTICWSPDSKWIAYNSWVDTKVRLESTLWKADLGDFIAKVEERKNIGTQIPPDGTFVDSRDGNIYEFKIIGKQTWMAGNLAWLPEVNHPTDTSSVYKRYYIYGYEGDDPDLAKSDYNYTKYGVLYNWKAAINEIEPGDTMTGTIQGACPDGWHLPDDAEWMELERTLGMSEDDLIKQSPELRESGFVGNKLKSIDGWEDDGELIGSSGFNAQAGGIMGADCRSVVLNQMGNFWTSSTLNGLLIFRSLILSKPGIYRQVAFAQWPAVFSAQKPPVGRFGISIRCVKDM
jgi:uncharacterized protein (TIGR02145 family)